MILFELDDSEKTIVVIERQQGQDSGGWSRLQEAFANDSEFRGDRRSLPYDGVPYLQ